MSMPSKASALPSNAEVSLIQRMTNSATSAIKSNASASAWAGKSHRPSLSQISHHMFSLRACLVLMSQILHKFLRSYLRTCDSRKVYLFFKTLILASKVKVLVR